MEFPKPVVKLLNGCIEPISKSRRAEYILIKYDGVQWYSHRLSYCLNVRDVGHSPFVDDGVMVLHRCDNKRCINPSHLYEGGTSENMKDAWARHPTMRANRSASLKGNQYAKGLSHWAGRSHTPETKERLSRKAIERAIREGKTVRKFKPKMKLGDQWMGRKHSPETIAKMKKSAIARWTKETENAITE